MDDWVAISQIVSNLVLAAAGVATAVIAYIALQQWRRPLNHDVAARLLVEIGWWRQDVRNARIKLAYPSEAARIEALFHLSSKIEQGMLDAMVLKDNEINTLLILFFEHVQSLHCAVTYAIRPDAAFSVYCDKYRPLPSPFDSGDEYENTLEILSNSLGALLKEHV